MSSADLQIECESCKAFKQKIDSLLVNCADQKQQIIVTNQENQLLNKQLDAKTKDYDILNARFDKLTLDFSRAAACRYIN